MPTAEDLFGALSSNAHKPTPGVPSGGADGCAATAAALSLGDMQVQEVCRRRARPRLVGAVHHVADVLGEARDH